MKPLAEWLTTVALGRVEPKPWQGRTRKNSRTTIAVFTACPTTLWRDTGIE